MATFQSLRPEEFSSGGFGLRSFRRPVISVWADISDISDRNFRIFQRRAGRGGKRRGQVVNGFKYCLVKVMAIFPKFSDVSRSSFPKFSEVFRRFPK